MFPAFTPAISTAGGQAQLMLSLHLERNNPPDELHSEMEAACVPVCEMQTFLALLRQAFQLVLSTD